MGKLLSRVFLLHVILVVFLMTTQLIMGLDLLFGCIQVRLLKSSNLNFLFFFDYTLIFHLFFKFNVLIYIFWIAEGELKVEDLPIFWLPQYQVKFNPPNGSSFLINSSTTVHCTTSASEVGVLGIALAQKRNVIVQTKKAVEDPSSNLGVLYLKAKERYEIARVWQILCFFPRFLKLKVP